MNRVKNYKLTLFKRALFALLEVLLTASTARANDDTVTYNLYWTGSETSATGYVQRDDNSNLNTSWHVGIGVLWPANATHGVNDEYDISIKPSVKLNAATTGDKKRFKTTNNTSFTVTADAANQYLIKSVVFKNTSGNVVGSVYNVNGQTATVLVGSGIFIYSVTVVLSPYSDQFYANATGTEYTITSAMGWNLFCNAVNDGTIDFSGKTVRLAGDISVVQMAGTSDHKFSGTFDGQGHTLTFNQGTNSSQCTTQYVAPFRFVEGATIRNLRTTGTICTSQINAAGIIAYSAGNVTLTNCRSSMAINSSVSGDGTHGGLIAYYHNSGLGYTLYIDGCLFDGRLCGTGTTCCGGFIGWRSGGATIHNSMFDPAEVTVGTDNSATFARNGVDTYNSYFTYLLNDGTRYKPILADGNVSPMKYNNGQQAYRVATGEHLFIVTGDSTVYSVSGITSYNNKDLLKYGNTYYAGHNETVTVGMETGYVASATPTVAGYGVTPTVSGSGPWSFPMPAANVLVSATTDFDPAHLSVTEGRDTYTIHSATGWDMFCDFLQDNDTYNRFADKTVQLGADITVSRMAGSSYHDMKGTFDGQGHTLTVSYGSPGSPVGEDNAAPFRNAEDGCTIKNLHVAGHIYTSGKYAAGLVGTKYGTVTIENCRSSVTIHSHTAGDGTHGGLLGRHAAGTLNIEGSVFDGKMLNEGTTATHSCGGLVGWCSTTTTISNCIYAPAALAAGEAEVGTAGSATIARQNSSASVTITNCYHTRTLNTVQGQLMHSILPGDNTTITFDGTATVHNVSTITAYTLEGNTLNPGLKYGNTLYSASGNTVRLILDAEAGHYFSGYTTSPVTAMTVLDSQLSTFHCQLAMPNQDVTITGTPASVYNIVYDLDGGSTSSPQANPTTYTSQTPTFTLVNPTRQFYEFIGWTGTDLTEPTVTVEITQGSTGHRSYTAHWNPLCPAPTGLVVSNVTQTAATLGWTAGGTESSWDILVTTQANLVPDEGTTHTILNSQFSILNLTGLSAGTTYYAYVRANCDNHSPWSGPVVFSTPCNAVDLPYSEDFSSPVLSHCWTTHVYDHYNSSIDIRDNALSFRIGNNNIMAAVLPEMNSTYNLRDYQISFDACCANFDNTSMTTGIISIGIMDNPADLATFVEIKVVDITDEYPTYGRHTVRFNHYSGSGYYIAIRNVYLKNGYILIDNLSVEPLPACLEPTGLTVATNGYDATAAWESEVTGASYEVALSTTATDHPEDSIVGQTTNTTYSFTNAQTRYGDNYLYVRTRCGEGSYSEWVGTRFAIGYCTPNIQSRDENGIIGVKFGSGEHVVDTTSTDGLPSARPYYGDYSSLVGDIQANADDTITITTNTGEYYSYVYTIWVDLNQDLLFEDDELLWIDEAVNGDATLEAPIVIPANTPAGDYRMRIFGADDYFNEFFNNGIIDWDAPHDVCRGTSWATACDFTVHVIAAPSCRPPIGLGATLSADANNAGKLKAELHWKSNSATPENSWTLYWKNSDSAAYNTPISISNNPTYTLTGLEINTDYEFYVEANCSGSPASSKVFHFTTPCYPVNAPWSENFDSLTEPYSIPGCWDNSEGSIVDASYKWCYDDETYGYGACNGTSHDGSKCVRFNSVDSDRRETNYLKSVPVNLPEGTPMKLTFWYKNPSGGDYSVLLSTDGGNTYDTVFLSGLKVTNWTQSYPIYLHRYRGQMVVFIFKGTSNWGADDSFLYLDDVEVSAAPECAPPAAVTVSAASNSAVLNWIGNTESAWTVYYRVENGEWRTESVTHKPYTLTNLEENTDYQFYVKANCGLTPSPSPEGEGSTSEPSETISFHTLCNAVLVDTDHPYTENFDDEDISAVYNHNAIGIHIPDCWDIDPCGDNIWNLPKVLADSSTRNYTRGTDHNSQVLYFYGSGFNYAALPVFQNPIRSLEISFRYAFESLQGDGSLTFGFIFPGDVDFNTFDTISYLTINSQSDFEAKKFYTVTKNLKYEVPDRASRLVFRWYNKYQWGCNVDDIVIKLRSDNIDKTILGYGDDPKAGRWYLIANPWVASQDINDVGHLKDNTWDLYRFDQAAENEWQNFKATDANGDTLHTDFTSLVNGQGYLYANSHNVTLNFWGQPYIGDGKITLRRVEGKPLTGWNLIGNPWTESARINDGKPFYRMNDAGTELVADINGYIDSTEAIFVYANSNGDTVTFTPKGNVFGFMGSSNSSKTSESQIVLNLFSQPTTTNPQFSIFNSQFVDRAIIHMGEGETLPKFQINKGSTKLYIPQEGRDYAVASGAGRDEMALNFKAATDGTYTIMLSSNQAIKQSSNQAISYLHLIDQKTGADIDLIASPIYTFKAFASDPASRFRLVFSENDNPQLPISNSQFARIEGDRIVVTGSGTLQAYDIVGRLLFSKEIKSQSSISNSQFPGAGIYVLRLGGQSQKIVLR